ncbi:MAG: FKBP-type peptidyl-prolyl cis-trans isomerase [Omnitrophica WOR_2 bacterium]
MNKKNRLREQRRAARAARVRQQRMTVAAITVVVLVIAGFFIIRGYFNQRSAAQAAEATTTAQMATNTVIAQTSQVLAVTQTAEATSRPSMAFPGIPTDVITTTTGLKYKDLIAGTGTEAKSGSQVTVNYTGWLTDGTKFDSSLDSGKPFAFQIDAGNVIKGWDEGVTGMKAGGKRILVIPPDLGYGSSANGSIPANSTLIFEVDLLSVQ